MPHTHRELPPNPELGQPVAFPNGLRNDGYADTYVSPDGGTFLVPRTTHDFEFSRQLHEAGLSEGEVREVAGTEALYYPASADLVTLPAIINGSINVAGGEDDVVLGLSSLGVLLDASYVKFEKTPGVSTIYGVAIDRTSGLAEPLAPYVSTSERPDAVIEAIRMDALRRSSSMSEEKFIATCFKRFVEMRSI